MAAADEPSSKFTFHAFTFGKSLAPKKLEASVIAENVKEDNNDTAFVASFDGRELKSSHQEDEDLKKTLVIPLIDKNRWQDKVDDKFARKTKSDISKKEEDKGDTERSAEDEKEDIDSLAIKELKSDASKQNEDWEERGDPGYSKLSIPILMQNKVPEGYETDEKLDVSLRPDGPEETDYDAVPVEAFGFAMLRGMGWKDGEGIGKDKKLVDQIEPGLRPKGLGLGADRNNTKKSDKDTSKNEDEEDLEMKKGSYCQVLRGHHKELYGEIIAIDEDNARVMVKLTIGGETVNLLQFAVRLVAKKEYDKNSKYLNKSKVDRYKEQEEKQRTRHANGSEREDSRHRSRSRDRDLRKSDSRGEIDSERTKSDYRKDRDKERRRDREGERDKNRYRDQERDYERRDKERNSHRKEDKRHEVSNKSQDISISSSSRLWIRPQCRVRIVDKKYHKGKYYKEKVVVVDVMGEKNCLCKTDDGKLLEGLSQSMLETIIPRSNPSYVVIVKGKYCGQLAEVIDKDKKDCAATVQLLSDRDKALKLDFDSICEYMGDIDAEMEY